MSEDDIIEGEGGARADSTEVLVELGKKFIIESVAVINDYVKTMIPLTTGLITVYFALLEFLGVKTAINAQIIGESTLLQPPMFLLYGLIAFIVTLFPLFMKLDIGNIPSIVRFRYIMIGWRYAGAATGMGFFLYGLYLIITTVTTVISFNT
jgi:hypothetical protein